MLLVLFSCALLPGQPRQRLDSLHGVLTQLPTVGTSAKADTVRLQTLLELARLEPSQKQADAYLQTASELITRYRWYAAQPWCQLYRGMVLFRESYIYQAIDQLIEALTTGERIGASSAFFAKCNRQLGSCYFSLEEYKLALLHYKRTLSLYEKDGARVAPVDLYIVKNNIGLCYMNLDQYAQAIAFFTAILRTAHAQNDSTALAWTYSNLGMSERKAGDGRSSIGHFEQSLRFFGTKPSDNKALTISELGLSYLALGELQKALQMSNAARQMAVEGKPFFSLYIAEAAYKTEKANGLYRQALLDLERYNALKLINDKELKQKSIKGLRLAYDNQKKETELQKQRLQNAGLLTGVVAAGLFLLFFIFNQRVLRRKNRKIESQKQLIEEANAQLVVFNEELEARVQERTQQLQLAYDEIKTAMTRGQTMERKRVASELHDNLGSMISGIKFQMQAIDTESLILKEQAVYNKVYEMLGNAYDEIRNISHNLIPVALETKGLYAALSGLLTDLNANSRIHFRLIADTYPQFSREVDVELYSILLELTNNILKHSTATEVVIAFTDEPGGTSIILQDNGQPYAFQAGLSGKGVTSVMSRVASLDATIQHQPALPTGNCVTITLALVA